MAFSRLTVCLGAGSTSMQRHWYEISRTTQHTTSDEMVESRLIYAALEAILTLLFRLEAYLL